MTVQLYSSPAGSGKASSRASLQAQEAAANQARLALAAKQALAEEDWQTAKSLLVELCRVAPKSVSAHFNLGMLLHQQNAINSAEKVFVQTLSLDPNHQPTLRELGTIWAGKRKYDHALRAFGRVASLDPNDEEARYYIGALLIETGKPEKALKHLEKAANNEATAYYRAKALIILGRLHDAIEDLRRLRPLAALQLMTGQCKGVLFMDQRLYHDILGVPQS